MRIWDVAAGYLNRQSLLGEHRELHGLHNIVTLGRRGYASIGRR
ncbi:MAG TPA: pyrimidine dimer DNA glycosylase/endonuclease V [Vicinamibacterales bacterium]|nr:pyrimidine dimer DNA glycosylase/endonuclease V [Vicinamibacterales bacterium]